MIPRSRQRAAALGRSRRTGLVDRELPDPWLLLQREDSDTKIIGRESDAAHLAIPLREILAGSVEEVTLRIESGPLLESK